MGTQSWPAFWGGQDRMAKGPCAVEKRRTWGMLGLWPTHWLWASGPPHGASFLSCWVMVRTALGSVCGDWGAVCVAPCNCIASTLVEVAPPWQPV